MSSVATIESYPDVSFIEDYTMAQLAADMVSWYREKKKELTGIEVSLGDADDRRLILLTGAYYIYQAYQFVDKTGKMGLLKYATGDFLENLGALKGVTRLPAAGSTVTLRYSMNNARSSATSVPAGSRATAGDGVFFSTDEYAEIPAGSLYVDIPASCTSVGTATNNYAVGEITTMESGVPFIDAVSNVTAAQNGRDIETDDELRERIFLAPESFTSAGSLGAYEYWVRSYDSSVKDVRITSPSERVVEVLAILGDGSLPDTEYINGLTEFLSQDDIKMLTDVISVQAPGTVTYNVNLTYYINESNRASAATIQSEVNAAIASYIEWQSGKIGRDINPNELMKRIILAGAKRVEITAPVFTVIPESSVGVLGTQTVNYGGLEDD